MEQSDSVIKVMDYDPVITGKQKSIQIIADAVSSEAVRVGINHSQEQIMSVLINNVQALVGTFIPFPIPQKVIASLSGKKLSKNQLDILQSISAKVIAYSGLNESK